MLQEDSLANGQEQAIELHAEQEAKVQHTYQVLGRLPKNSTPAQQDSAIQATFKPKETHGIPHTDTIKLPGYITGEKAGETALPQYYRQNFFSSDTTLHKEVKAGRYGIAGDPVPYTLRNDNTITLLLLVCFIVSVVSFANHRHFFARQAKRFFRKPRPDDNEETFTSSEVAFQLFLAGQAGLLLSLFQFFYTQQTIGDTFILPSQHLLIAIFFGMWAGYFAVRALLYTMVNTVFFGIGKNREWLQTLLFVTSIEGVALFPVVLVQVYFGLSLESVYICTLSILLLSKILVFYKCFSIFFRHCGGFLQIILYFCALEIVPLAALWGALIQAGNYLEINF